MTSFGYGSSICWHRLLASRYYSRGAAFNGARLPQYSSNTTYKRAIVTLDSLNVASLRAED